MNRFSLMGLLLTGSALGIAACAPTVGLGGDDTDAGTSDASTPVACANGAFCADGSVPDAALNPELKRVDVRLESLTRADGYPQELTEGASVSVAFFKTPSRLSEGVGTPGCREREYTDTNPPPAKVDEGRTGYAAAIGTAQATGAVAVPIVQDPPSSGNYTAALGNLPDGTDVTIKIDPGTPVIGGRTFVLKHRVLQVVSPIVSQPQALDFVGKPFSITWQPFEGPVFWSVSDIDKWKSGSLNSHYIDCWAGAGVLTQTAIDASLMSKMHWTTNKSELFAVHAFKTQTSTEPSGTTLNVSSDATATAFFLAQ